MSALQRLVAEELARQAPAAALAVAEAILFRHGDAVACILFYGARRRDRDTEGLLDLYVLFDRHRVFHRRPVTALFNWLLPPNVMFMRVTTPAGPVQAKVAMISRSAFAARMRPASLDTTIWTRFCQPSSLLHARDPAMADWAAATIADGIRTASVWARRAAAPGAGLAHQWRALFARTYALELRPETADRSGLVYQAASEWFEAIGAALAAEPLVLSSAHSWRIRAILGKPLNLLRLVKAAFTFEGGADYLASKLGKHTGVSVAPSAWQQRHPLLGAPGLLLSHRRRRLKIRS